MRPTPSYAPDGYTSGGDHRAMADRFEQASREGALTDTERLFLDPAAVVLAHERHDDGLVHGHDWARTEMMAGPNRQQMADPWAFAASRVDDRYDDGLVHSHDWAKSDVMPQPGRRAIRTNGCTPAAMALSDDRYDDGLVHNHNWAMTRA